MLIITKDILDLKVLREFDRYRIYHTTDGYQIFKSDFVLDDSTGKILKCKDEKLKGIMDQYLVTLTNELRQ